MFKKTVLTIALYTLAIGQTSGKLDPSFGPSGNSYLNADFLPGTSVNVLPTYSQIRKITLQPDGKIITAGSILNSMNREQFGISRYNANGSLDATFGTNGVSITSFGSTRDRIYTVGIQSNGKIIGAGTSELHPDVYRENALIRLNSNGTLDPTFGTNGSVIASVSTDSASAIHEIIILPNDKILALCTGWDGTSYRAHIVRYNANGSIDNTFGTNGATFTSLYATLWGMTLQADGKIITTGYVENVLAGTYDALIQRYTANGVLDSTFGTNGSFIKDFGTDDERFGLNPKIQPDGKIIAFGWVGLIGTTTAGTSNLLVGRFSPTGTPDSTFGTNGFVIQDEIDPIQLSRSISNRNYGGGVLLPNGKIIASSWNYYRRTSTPDSLNYALADFGLLRYNSNGTLDTTFGVRGYLRTPLTRDTAFSNQRMDDIKLLPNGKIIGAGASVVYRRTSNYISNVLARYIVCDVDSTVETRSILQGDSILFGGQYIKQAGAYRDTLTSIGGCDSIIKLTVSVTTDINEIDHQDLAIYPNPTSESFKFEVLNASEILVVELLDLNGKVVKSINPSSNLVNISHLPAGIYILNVQTKTKTSHHKILKF